MNDSFLWWRDGVIYQIYPRSFADSNQDGLGDIPGIIAKLDYLVDLGINAIWLSPIFPSPDADFGYDISDYCSVDPRFGDLADFDHLVEEAHKRKIRMILDLVLNHTSDQHPWFLDSRSSRDHPKRSWYLWRDPKPGGSRPNNWQSRFSGSGWEFARPTGQYYFHIFSPHQPDLNWSNPEVQAAMLNVVRFWLERGVDGFRLDVFNAYFKHPRFPDNPPRLGLAGFDRQRHRYDIDQPELLPFLAELRALLDSYPERYAVGETFESTPEATAAYCSPTRLHAAFDFAFTRSPWSPRAFLNAIRRWEAALGTENWPNYVLSNHDLPRAATRYAPRGHDERMKVAAALLLSLRGTPFLYYGEEIGMRDIALSRGEILDPPGKHYWPFYKGRDGCRSPMQWDSSLNAGLSLGKPWLPIHPGFYQHNVAVKSAEPESLLNFYRQMIALRRSSLALLRGSFEPLPQPAWQVMAFLRCSPVETVLVALNFSRQARPFVIDPPRAGGWQLLLSNRRSTAPRIVDGGFLLEPDEACILRIEGGDQGHISSG